MAKLWVSLTARGLLASLVLKAAGVSRSPFLRGEVTAEGTPFGSKLCRPGGQVTQVSAACALLHAHLLSVVHHWLLQLLHYTPELSQGSSHRESLFSGATRAGPSRSTSPADVMRLHDFLNFFFKK